MSCSVQYSVKIKEIKTGETWFGRNIISIQYWESFKKLEHFARAKDLTHLPEWQKFLEYQNEYPIETPK